MNEATIQILFFAGLKERVGSGKMLQILPQGTSVADLKARLMEQYPRLDPLLAHSLAAVNQQYAFNEDILPDGAEVAFFPPVSGGAGDALPTVLRVDADPLDLDDLVRQITLPSHGAAVIFTGMVRGITRRGEAHETVYLEYEAYVPMAEAKLAQIAVEIRARWPTVEGIALLQRIGRLEPGTPTVLIACTAAHRDTGVFDAARYGIDRLKEIVPVWKKEVGPQGQEWVEGDYIPGHED